MDLTSTKTIKELLSKYDARASRGLGQNFLIDKNILQKIIEAGELKKTDVVLEVGPGIGTLTKELAQKAKKVVAVEKDKKMFEILQKTLKDYKNIEIIHADILKIKTSGVEEKYKVIANIPYYITAPLIRVLLENKNQPDFMVLMVQKEVAQRICAKPPNMSLLAVSAQFYAEPKIVSYVSKNCFWPSPKVDSAIIKIIPRRPTSTQLGGRRASIQLFFKVVKAGFSQPRKQLVNNLATLKAVNDVKLTKAQISDWLLKNGLSPSQRAETLKVEDWIHLAKNFQNLKS